MEQKKAFFIMTCLTISCLASITLMNGNSGRKDGFAVNDHSLAASASTYISSTDLNDYDSGTRGDVVYYENSYFYDYAWNGTLYQIPGNVGSSVLDFAVSGSRVYFVQWYSNVSQLAVRYVFYGNGTIKTVRLVDPTSFGGAGSKFFVASPDNVDLDVGIYILLYFRMSVNSVTQGFIASFTPTNQDYQTLSNLLLSGISWGYDNYFYGYNSTGITQGSIHFTGWTFGSHPNVLGSTLVYATTPYTITAFDVGYNGGIAALCFYLPYYGLVEGDCNAGTVTFTKIIDDSILGTVPSVFIGTDLIYYKNGSWDVYKCEMDGTSREWVTETFSNYNTIVESSNHLDGWYYSQFDFVVYLGGNYDLRVAAGWDNESFYPLLSEYDLNMTVTPSAFSGESLSWNVNPGIGFRESQNTIDWIVEVSTSYSFPYSTTYNLGSATSVSFSSFTGFSSANNTYLYVRIRGVKDITWYNGFGVTYSKSSNYSQICTIHIYEYIPPESPPVVPGFPIEWTLMLAIGIVGLLVWRRRGAVSQDP